MIKYEVYTKEQIEFLKDSYVGNECDSDQYRETQPVSGLWQICSVGLLPSEVEDIISKHIDGVDDSEEIDSIEEMIVEMSWVSQEPIVLEVIRWLNEAKLGSYCGSDLLYPILERVFDLHVEASEHPYYGTQEEVQEWIEDMYEEV